ncbi:MAG: beta-glucuronidase [Lentisphaerae bacterium]|nr:beta-glucuronidase [Lentisphaerota bacterium]
MAVTGKWSQILKNTGKQKMSCTHPNPQFARSDCVVLNGKWSCRFDPGKSGAERQFEKSQGFEIPINVPFCPESKLSGVEHTDFIECMWYHRPISIPREWTGKVILLHFGGVDYRCNVYINGVKAGSHTGGVSPFAIDISACAEPGRENDLVLEVYDEQRSHNQAFGKQSPWYDSRQCSYTRTTGIWSTVYMECCSTFSLSRCRIVPDLDNNCFYFSPEFRTVPQGGKFKVTLSHGGKTVASVEKSVTPGLTVAAEIENPRLWSPVDPFLYDVKFELFDPSGTLTDTVFSYAGLRKFHIEGKRFYLNNEPIFLRMVLDQGFYEEGLWTAPDDAALENDIRLAMRAGFNGARLHQKIFDPRYHYHADRLGFLTFGEFPDWGMGFWMHFTNGPCDVYRSFRDYLAQWREVLDRDMNHPSIIGWTPFNETCFYRDLDEHRRILSDIYRLTKQLDPTRVVCDSSGYTHAETDIWSVHNYNQDPKELAAQLAAQPVYCREPENELQAYKEQPLFVGEYGGVKHIPEKREPWKKGSWGYGNAPANRDEALQRMYDLTEVAVASGAAGFCYTQLTDIEQEQNGVWNYDRTPKFSEKELQTIFLQKPDWSKF